MRVPSSTVSLEHARAEGARVEVVYSPRDALEIARASPEQTVIFLAVGFETTVPTIAGALAEAWVTILKDREQRREMGARAREGAFRDADSGRRTARVLVSQLS